MYYIVDAQRWWAYKRSFGKFADAFMILQLVWPDAHIEYFDGVNREICWDPNW